MWFDKDALKAVSRYFCKNEAFVLLRRTHRVLGLGISYYLVLLGYLGYVAALLLFSQIRIPIAFLILFLSTVLVIRYVIRRSVLPNRMIMTDLSIYRCVGSKEPRIIQSVWTDVTLVVIKRSRLCPSYAHIKIRCDKDRLPPRVILPSKLFRMRFGKIKVSKIHFDLTHSRPILQYFAIDSVEEFLHCLQEIRTMPNHTFVIKTQGL